MSGQLWQSKLQETLSNFSKPLADLRIAIVGIGSELRGDDIAGAEIADMLQPVAQTSNRLLNEPNGQNGRGNGPNGPLNRLLVVNAGPAPENFTSPLRRFQPNLVLLIDAAQMGAAPGTICLLPWQETEGISASTHTLPLHVFAGYISNEMNCEVLLLGIEPTDISFGAPLSEPVHQALHEVARELPVVLGF